MQAENPDIVIQPLNAANQADLNCAIIWDIAVAPPFRYRGVMPGTREVAVFWYRLL